jgi:hypothetical protein
MDIGQVMNTYQWRKKQVNALGGNKKKSPANFSFALLGPTVGCRATVR